MVFLHGLAALAAKITSASTVAQATAGLGIAVAGVTGAGAAGVLPGAEPTHSLEPGDDGGIHQHRGGASAQTGAVPTEGSGSDDTSGRDHPEDDDASAGPAASTHSAEVEDHDDDHSGHGGDGDGGSSGHGGGDDD